MDIGIKEYLYEPKKAYYPNIEVRIPKVKLFITFAIKKDLCGRDGVTPAPSIVHLLLHARWSGVSRPGVTPIGPLRSVINRRLDQKPYLFYQLRSTCF